MIRSAARQARLMAVRPLMRELVDAYADTPRELGDGRQSDDAAAGAAAPVLKRFLVVDQSGQLGGAELALIPLLTHWRTRCKVVLLADGPFRQSLEQLDVDVSVLAEARVSAVRKGATRFGMLFALTAMLRQVKALARRAASFDVLYLNTQKALVLGALAGARARRPVVWHVHDIMDRQHFGRVQLLVVRWIVRHLVDRVIANSQASADALLALTGIEPASVSVLHNGMSAESFQQIEPDQALRQRRALGLPDGALVVGLFGRLAHWKGAHVALEALALLPGMHLLLVGAALFGEADYEAFLRRRVAELKLGERVHFLGFRDDIPLLMKTVDVVLHASIAAEPFGRVVVEGMLARRPVVATAAGGVLEIIEHRRSGLLIRPDDAYSLADALAALASSPSWARRIGEQAYASASSRFSLERYVDAVSHCLQNAERTGRIRHAGRAGRHA